MLTSLPGILAGGSPILQDSPAGPLEAAAPSIFDKLELIDYIAMLVLGVFFLLGLVKGFWWQFSRIATLVAAWFLALAYGKDGEAIVVEWFDPAASPSELPLFLSYVCIFIVTVVVLSIVSRLLQKVIEGTGLSFYNRAGGAVLGLGTGAIAVIAVLAGITFLDKNSAIVKAADRSLTMDYSRKTLESPIVNQMVPGWMLARFDIHPPVPRKMQDARSPDGGKAAGSSKGK